MMIAVEMAADSYQAVAEKLSLPINNVKGDSIKLLQDTMWTAVPLEDQEHKFKECWEQG